MISPNLLQRYCFFLTYANILHKKCIFLPVYLHKSKIFTNFAPEKCKQITNDIYLHKFHFYEKIISFIGGFDDC